MIVDYRFYPIDKESGDGSIYSLDWTTGLGGLLDWTTGLTVDLKIPQLDEHGVSVCKAYPCGSARADVR